MDVEQSAAEIHGLVTGWVCAGASFDKAGRIMALSEWLDTELDAKGTAMLERLHEQTAASVDDEAFSFSLVVPDDGVAMQQRAAATSEWCSGFLYGFGMTGKFRKEDLAEDVAEVLGDLAKIAAVSDDVPEDDENEADLMEIIEYVRMAAMLIHAECSQRAVH